ncbi:MAG TPA: hypothetical protein PKL52_10270 [Tenuifilaceae bacterium]|nr:hypothetical protein [Tenuifilaceae bacterium]
MRFQIRPGVVVFLLLLGVMSCRESKELSFWSLIDPNTILAYESTQPVLVRDKEVGSILHSLSAKEYITCVQSITKNSYDLIYVCNVTDAEWAGISSANKVSNRLLDGITIFEVKNEGGTALAWANLEGYLIISKSSILIENAIRIYRSSQPKNFKSENPQIFGFVTIKSDAGNVWVNYDQLNKTAVPLFKTIQSIPLFKNLATSSVLDVAQSDDQISLSGFTLDLLNKDWGLFRFQNQSPVKIEVMRFVPNTTKVFIHYGISNVDALITGDPDEPQKSDLRDEVGICLTDDEVPVVLLKVKEEYAFDKYEYVESYAGYDIRKVNDGKLSDPIKPLLPEINLAFLTFKDDYIFLSENTEALKQIIDAIEADETWGRSVAFQHFFNTCLQEGNVSVFFNKAALLGSTVNNDWKPILDSLHLTSMTWGSLQFNSLDNHFFTSANFYIDSKKQPERIKPDRKLYELPNNLASSYMVKNHTGGPNELLVQDSTYKVYLFSKQHGVQWVYSLNEKLEQVQQLDYFKNGKLQYLITTPSYIYLIDRLGRDVDGFPKKKDLNYKFSEVVDYDKSRNYRLLLTSGDRDIFILDKTMKELEGWAPKKLNSKILFPPKHYRIGGRDYFVVITENGQLHVFNRRGEYEKGFPLAIDKNISGDYFLEQGTSLASSVVYFISKDGKIQKVKLDGEQTTESLIRGDKSTFTLAVSTAGKPDFYFFRVDTDKIAVFDRKGQLVFERQNPGSLRLKPGVVKTTDGPALFAFFDEEQKLCYFYNTLGNAAINRPVEATLPPVYDVNLKSKQVTVYSVYQNTITTTPLN